MPAITAGKGQQVLIASADDNDTSIPRYTGFHNLPDALDKVPIKAVAVRFPLVGAGRFISKNRYLSELGQANQPIAHDCSRLPFIERRQNVCTGTSADLSSRDSVFVDETHELCGMIQIRLGPFAFSIGAVLPVDFRELVFHQVTVGR